MKIRQGQVSNSSTTSFVIALSKGQRTVQLTLDVDINSLTTTLIETEAKLLDYIRQDLRQDGYSENRPEDTDTYIRGMAEFKAGNVLRVLKVSNNDDSIISSEIYSDPSVITDAGVKILA